MRLGPLFLPLFLLAPALSGQELAVHGRPRPGDSLWIEVVAPGGRSVKLAYDFQTGSGTWNGVPLGLKKGRRFGILGLGATDARGWLGKPVPIPAKARLDGKTIFVQALVADPSATGGWATTAVEPVPLAAGPDLAPVNDYVYQLQGNPATNDLVDPAALAATQYDLIVTDYSKDGSEAQRFTPAEVELMRNGPVEHKIVLAYLSIGEAEDFRWYWPFVPPQVLAGSNPNYPGSFKVRYWMPEWKEIILTGNQAVGEGYLDRIIDQGFDGVFLDIVDAFEFFGPVSEGGVGEKDDAALAMMEFLFEIARHARVERGRPDFLVVPQNGLTIYTEGFYPAATLRSFDPATPAKMAARQLDRFAATIDFVATEDVFFRGNKAQNNPFDPDPFILGLIGLLQGRGRPVFSTEYVTDPGKLDRLYDQAAPAAGVVPLATVRPLDRIPANPGHPPD